MVFLGITGPSASGKRTLANLFVEKYGFKFLQVKERPSKSSMKEEQLQSLENFKIAASCKEPIIFPSPKELISFVLFNYAENFVTVISDVHFEACYNIYSARPCFLGIAIDCPLNVRSCS